MDFVSQQKKCYFKIVGYLILHSYTPDARKPEVQQFQYMYNFLVKFLLKALKQIKSY